MRLEIELEQVVHPNPASARTYVLRYEEDAWVLDPGLKDATHLDAVLAAVGANNGARLRGVLVSHRRAEHADSAGTLRRLTRSFSGQEVPVWAQDNQSVPLSRKPPAIFAPIDGALLDDFEGQVDAVAHVVSLPGIAEDVVGLLCAGGQLLVGPALRPGANTLLEHPDGDPRVLQQTLNIIDVMCRDGRIATLHPAFGQVLDNPIDVMAEVDRARQALKERVEFVEQARAAGLLMVEKIIRAGVELGHYNAEEAGNGRAEADVRALTAHLLR